MTRKAACRPALTWLLVAILSGAVKGNEIPSVWRVIDALPHTAAVNSSLEDPSLICMDATRTDYNLTAETATYLVHYKGTNGTEDRFVTYDYTRADPDVPNKCTLVIGKDYGNPVTVTFGYSDYESCYVGILPFGDKDQCILLVDVEFLGQVPQKCNEAFTNICGAGFLVYNKDLCGF